MWSLTFNLLSWIGANVLVPPLSGTKRLYRAWAFTQKQKIKMRINLHFGHFYIPLTDVRTHLVRLRGLVEHASIDGRSHQVVGSCDGVNVTSEMEVKLQRREKIINKRCVCFFSNEPQNLWWQSLTSSIGMTWEYPPPAAPPSDKNDNYSLAVTLNC